MQLPPLEFMDVSLLLALGAIVFFITAELVSPRYGLTNSTVNRKRLRTIAYTIGVLFLITVAIRVTGIVFNI